MTEDRSQPVETELKLVVEDRAALDRILTHLGPPRSTQDQHNRYFDTDDGAWSRHGLAVRLRRQSGTLKLTVKSGGADEGDFVRRGEWETELPVARESGLAGGGLPLLGAVRALLEEHGEVLPAELADAPPHEIGTMTNVRRRAELPGHDGLLVELDETTYPNGDVRFEVELEVPDATRAAAAVERLRASFDAAGVAWKPSKVSKRERLERVLRGESA